MDTLVEPSSAPATPLASPTSLALAVEKATEPQLIVDLRVENTASLSDLR